MFYESNEPSAGGEAGARGASKKMMVTNAPNHVKYWFLYNQNKDMVKDRLPLSSGGDPLKDSNLYPAIWMNFENLVEVQVLLGFKATDFYGKRSMKSPIWTTLTGGTLRSSGTHLCRLAPYQSEVYGISRPKELELPILNQYFLLQAGSPTPTRGLTSPTIREANKRVVNKLAVKEMNHLEYAQTNLVSADTRPTNEAIKFMYQKTKRMSSGENAKAEQLSKPTSIVEGASKAPEIKFNIIDGLKKFIMVSRVEAKYKNPTAPAARQMAEIMDNALQKQALDNISAQPHTVTKHGTYVNTPDTDY